MSDSSAFLFSLTAQLHYPVKDTDAIYCDNINGPSFGLDDLSAYGDASRVNAFRSYANRASYLIGVDSSGRNMLTLSENEYFTISELEVWHLTHL